jgi:hypothetical protein
MDIVFFGGQVMFKKSRARIASCLILAILLTACMAGCQQKVTTTAGDITSETTAPSTGPTTEATTSATTETTTAETSASVSETTTAEATTASSQNTAAPSIYYSAFPANHDVKADLNDDGLKETLSYSCPDKTSFNLVVDGKTTQREGENFLSGWFFLIDLDSEDPYIDVAIQESGPGYDDQVTFYYFNGSSLVLRGVVPGTICAIGSPTISSDQLGTGDIRFDGHGGLIGFARGHVLQTWFYDEPWFIGEDLLLAKTPQDYYPIRGYDPDTDEELPEMPVKMKMNLPLADQPGSSEIAAIARSGQAAALVKTDDAAWVQLRTQSGVLGWFRVDGFNVLINGTSYFSDDVFEGLTMAD